MPDTQQTKVLEPVAPPSLPEDTPPAPARRRSSWFTFGVVLVVLGLVAGGVFFWRRDASGGTTPTVPAAEAEAGSPSAVAEALGPAVVHIEILGGLDAGGGVGSGVIYDTTGLVLTAHHVVSFSDEVTIMTADDRTFNGRVVGRAPERDLAVVALDEASDLTAATIAEPGTVEVGEPAIALGSPFGFQQSVTAGIISGLDRELETPLGLLTGLIQTDAPINPGNSGGPLADAEAKVIGINTAIASMSGGNDGVGFAVPVEDFADLISEAKVIGINTAIASMSGGNDGVGFAVPVVVFADLISEVETAGGIDAPTVPAPDDASGLDSLVPGLQDLLPGLEDLFNLDNPQGLPGLEEMLDQLFGMSDLPPELQELLDGLLGPTDQGGASS